MNDQEIRDAIKTTVVGTGIEESQITDDALWEHDLCMDSLDFVEVVMLIEKKLGIVITDVEIENVDTVKQFMDLVIEIKNR